MSEAGHERHNRVAFDLASSIMTEVGETEDRLLILESVVSAVIGLMTKNAPDGVRAEARQEIANILHAGVKERLEKQA